MKNSLVSIIVTTKNEAAIINRLLRSIKKQLYTNVELIIVDNSSTDKTKEKARMFTNKIYDKGPERSAQRNFGAQKAKGKYLLFLDADMVLTKLVVRESIKIMEANDKIGALIIPEKSVARNFWEKVKAFERSFYNLDGDEITNAARFFSKEAFNEIGGYDEKITGPEDWDLTDRVKKARILLGKTKALIYHFERIPNLYSLLRKKYYYGLKSGIYLNKHQISLVSPKTIYFLRPAFYKQWQVIFAHPVLGASMFFVFILEMIAGGLGYLKGKFNE